jgi:hypothetical protein
MPCSHSENKTIVEERDTIKQHSTGVVKRLAGNIVVAFVDVDEVEVDEDLKLQALESALGKIDLKTRRRLDGLNVYLSPAVRCIAFLGTAQGRRTYTIFLGPQMLTKTAVMQTEAVSHVKGGTGHGRGVADQQYDAMRKPVLSPTRLVMGKDAYQTTKIAAKAMAVIVHEFGHLLHEANDPKKYWRLKKTDRDLVKDEFHTAMKVSQYALNGKLEFVAEVFTGRMFGAIYPPDVLSLYKSCGGIEIF